MCALTNRLAYANCLISADAWKQLRALHKEYRGGGAHVAAVETRAQRNAGEERMCNAGRNAGVTRAVTSLATPTLQTPHVLSTEASSVAVIPCLKQMQDDGYETITIGRSRCTPTQIQSATTQLEAFTIVLASKQFQACGLRARITVIANHYPLSHLTCSMPQGVKLTCWWGE
ncbi:hypothetical protein MRX96_009089 [Rhipicephalus microplus]